MLAGMSSPRYIGIRRRSTTVTIPDRVGPHVKLVFASMRRLNKTYDDVEFGSGIRRAALKAWRNKNRPSLESIEAVLGYLGFDFLPIPRAKVLPPEIVAELRPIAERLEKSMPETIAALTAIVTGVHDRFGAESFPAPEGASALPRA